MNKMEKGYSYLLKNLSDSIFEMMIKLDETTSNSMCIYYTEDLAAYLLGVPKENIKDEIYSFKNYISDELGKTDITFTSDGRFGIVVYSDGIEKIMASNPRKLFLKELIEKIRSRNCSLNEIKHIFEKENSNYICEKINNSEFQYVLYFIDKNIDEYKYCFTFDIMGSYYHRLIDYDFDALIHDNCGHKHQ